MLLLQNIHKSFKKGHPVLWDVTFRLMGGEVLGLLGPNGAGKTTTLRIITGLVQPDSGTVSLMGKNILEHPETLREHIGYVADAPFLYPKLTGLELLLFIADIRRMPRQTSWQRIEELLASFELSSARHQYIEEYSLGMHRKLAFCAALLHRPQVLVLDEPLNGLDPKAVRSLKAMFETMRQEGKSILMSTHLLDVAEHMCDAVVIIQNGRVAGDRQPTSALAQSLEDHFFATTERMTVE